MYMYINVLDVCVCVCVSLSPFQREKTIIISGHFSVQRSRDISR